MNNTHDIGRLWPGWQIEGVLGTGPFGTVYLAHSLVCGRTVFAAVKVITMPPGREAVENAEKQGISRELLGTYFGKFKNDLAWELTMFRTISAPGIIPVDELAVQNNDPMGWTGYLRSGVYTPAQVYFEKTPPGADEARRLGLELCAALEACEEYGMVHGEIKPENLFVTDEGTFMLADFGIRRSLERAGTGIFVNRGEEFDAPEIRSGEREYSAASDIYSLGMLMLWTLRGGALPKSGAREKKYDDEPALEAVISKATAELPENRYGSAAALREELLRIPGSGKRTVRRAMAVATAIEAVKRNGGVIRPLPREKAQEEKPKRGLFGFIKAMRKGKKD